ncbi:hypothetical protein ABZW30_39950 [Kitasatospora sp. NPDC004669]|uniref:hypothetical protein n=1 Tax=Kitasatospora sp. NPDC004669 TaxID=3154555 RepID=UPI0033A736EB
MPARLVGASSTGVLLPGGFGGALPTLTDDGGAGRRQILAGPGTGLFPLKSASGKPSAKDGSFRLVALCRHPVRESARTGRRRTPSVDGRGPRRERVPWGWRVPLVIG